MILSKDFDYCDVCEVSERVKTEVVCYSEIDYDVNICEDCLNKMLKVLKEDK